MRQKRLLTYCFEKTDNHGGLVGIKLEKVQIPLSHFADCATVCVLRV